MRLSIDGEESSEEAVGSLNFNNPPSSLQGVESRSSMLSQELERKEDICFDNPSSDPNIILEIRRVPVGSSGNGRERSEDT